MTENGNIVIHDDTLYRIDELISSPKKYIIDIQEACTSYATTPSSRCSAGNPDMLMHISV